MKYGILRYFISILGLFALVAARADSNELTAHPADPGDIEEHRKIIDNKLTQYRASFPEILFVHLEGGERWHGEMIALVSVLGTDAVPVDYEHPESKQGLLMNASLERLVLMLKNNIISATAFKPGADSSLEKQYLCVVTLNPLFTHADDLTATRYMLDMEPEEINRINPVRRLDHEDHLRFAIDHEVYHCLNSIYYGGAAMINDELDAEYASFRRESAADGFALAMNIKQHGEITNYARNIAHIRALWIFSDSPDRYTFETVREILKLDPDKVKRLSIGEIMGWARSIGERTVGNYENYVAHLVAALKAASVLGIDPATYGEVYGKLEQQPADMALVRLLVNRYRYYYDQLFTDQVVQLEAPPLH